MEQSPPSVLSREWRECHRESEVWRHHASRLGQVPTGLNDQMNLSDPNPSWFIKMWFYDHPTRPERVHFADDPWAQGKGQNT